MSVFVGCAWALWVSWAWGSRVLGDASGACPTPQSLPVGSGLPPGALPAEGGLLSPSVSVRSLVENLVCRLPGAVGCFLCPASPVSCRPSRPICLHGRLRCRRCPRASGDAGTQKLTCGFACGCGLCIRRFQWGAGTPPSASLVLQGGLGPCRRGRLGPGRCDPQVTAFGACVLCLVDRGPPSPVAGDEGLGRGRSAEVRVCAPSRGQSPSAGLRVLRAVRGPSLGHPWLWPWLWPVGRVSSGVSTDTGLCFHEGERLSVCLEKARRLG